MWMGINPSLIENNLSGCLNRVDFPQFSEDFFGANFEQIPFNLDEGNHEWT